MLAAVLLLAFFLPLKEWVASALDWCRELGFWGAPLLASLFVPACIFMLPGAPIGMATGFAFDFPIALLSVIVFSNLGAQASFLIGRSLFREYVSAWVASNPKRRAVEQAVSSQGFRLVLLLRLSPLIPFNALNYALSVSRIRFRSYALATLIGMLPGSLLFVSLASALGRAGRHWSDAEVDGGRTGDLLLVLGVASGILAIALVTKRAKALLSKELA